MKTSATKLMVGIGVLALTTACGESSSNPSPTGPSRTVTGVTIGGSTSVSAGGTAQLTATAQYSNQTNEPVTNQAAWTSSDPTVATISATGLLTALRTGSVDVAATFQNVVGRRTVQVGAARFQVRVALDGVTAIDTCDDFTQGLTTGQFAVQVRTVLANGTGHTLYETEDYPGNPARLRVLNLARGATQSLTATRTYTLDGTAGQFVRVEFRATEWDEQIVLIPPSTRWIPDSNMNNRLGTRTHSYTNGNFSNLGPGSITLGNSGCQIRLTYDVTATRQ